MENHEPQSKATILAGVENINNEVHCNYVYGMWARNTPVVSVEKAVSRMREQIGLHYTVLKCRPGS